MEWAYLPPHRAIIVVSNATAFLFAVTVASIGLASGQRCLLTIQLRSRFASPLHCRCNRGLPPTLAQMMAKFAGFVVSSWYDLRWQMSNLGQLCQFVTFAAESGLDDV